MLRFFNLNKKGYTMVELILVIALLGIIIYPISLFFITNYRSFYNSRDQITAQQQVQQAMNGFVDRAVEAKNIESLTDLDRNQIEMSNTNASDISRIVLFNVLDSDYFIFEFIDRDGDGRKELRFIRSSDENTSSTEKFADFVTQFRIEPLGGTYGTCTGIKIEITCTGNKGGYPTKISNEVYFRNRNTPNH